MDDYIPIKQLFKKIFRALDFHKSKNFPDKIHKNTKKGTLTIKEHLLKEIDKSTSAESSETMNKSL